MARRRALAEQRRLLVERVEVQRDVLTRFVGAVDALEGHLADLSEYGLVERLPRPLRDLADEARLFVGEACVGCGCTAGAPCEDGCELDAAAGVCLSCSGAVPALLLIVGRRAEA